MMLISKIMGKLSPQARRAINSVRDELSIQSQSKSSEKRLKTITGSNLRIHLGCGSDVRENWLNIDLPMPQGTGIRTKSSDSFVVYDLRQGLPLPSDSCAYIFSSHFFEHLEFEEGLRLMRDCYRCLVPGGVFRTALPDLKRIFEVYLAGDEDYFSAIDLRVLITRTPGSAAIVDWVNYGVYQFGEHKCIYDAEKLMLVLKEIGFTSVKETGYDPAVDVNSELRKRYTFYVEATK